jgi:hypothetical protein
MKFSASILFAAALVGTANAGICALSTGSCESTNSIAFLLNKADCAEVTGTTWKAPDADSNLCDAADKPRIPGGVSVADFAASPCSDVDLEASCTDAACAWFGCEDTNNGNWFPVCQATLTQALGATQTEAMAKTFFDANPSGFCRPKEWFAGCEAQMNLNVNTWLVNFMGCMMESLNAMFAGTTVDTAYCESLTADSETIKATATEQKYVIDAWETAVVDSLGCNSASGAAPSVAILAAALVLAAARA